MIRIPRTTLRALRRDIPRALGITSVKRAPAVTFRTTQDQLTIQAVTDHVAFEFRLPYETRFDDASECITVSNEVLRQCEGRTREIVTFEQRGDEIIVQWPDHSIPRVLTASASPPVPMPSVPGEFHVIQPQFLQAMTEASKTVSKETSRFAMDCIRLRGSDGQVAASDSHQVFTQTGFQFPWSDEVLVTSSPALQCSDFLHAPQVEIGRTDEWFFLRLPQQTLALRIETERRFPNVDLHVPTGHSASTTLTLSSGDATFLDHFLPRLPGADDEQSPVTVELNDIVAIRATDEDRQNTVELVLDESRWDGSELRFQTDRTYLARAAALGFREIHFRGSEAPAFCRDSSRTYVWALQSEYGIVPADESIPQIHSCEHQSDSFQPQPRNHERSKSHHSKPSGATARTSHTSSARKSAS